jgi:hypothetical protein
VGSLPVYAPGCTRHEERGEQRASGPPPLGGGADALAWLSHYRRLTVRYNRCADIHEAFLLLACSLVCLGYLLRSRF